ncbi:hypothetical protein I5M27_12595 [Adhaeribacter sp. BT258]|uniref:Uncharacterized protein n=1 Tax=Adhaeribacter terrigena TaxID=2793070 RepID=A0ABS1C356_9BACT|nr:hypothetical protein [Adhaeribacter terrigena]MBK0403831.1 hypothetical protein [Adhaeribacter terrigena]
MEVVFSSKFIEWLFEVLRNLLSGHCKETRFLILIPGKLLLLFGLITTISKARSPEKAGR